ncbi:MAG: polysaccharide deacetylase family protein [Bacillota bacterium]
MLNKSTKLIILLLFLVVTVSPKIFANDLPAIIFVYDDGFKEDFELAFPIHAKYNVPAVVAVNSDYIGQKHWLEQRELHFLQAKGWEIANHGKKHTALILNSLTKNAAKNTKKIEVKNPFLIEKSYEYLIYNTQTGLKEKIKIKKSGNKYIELKARLKNNYSKENTLIKLSDSALKSEILDSKRDLEKMGLIIDTFVFPYNGYYSLPLAIVKKNYKAARAGYRHGEKFPQAFINYKPFSQYQLKASALETNLINEKDIFKLLNEVKDKNGLLIFYSHPHNKNFDSKRIEKIIRYALKNKIKISTFRELF